MKARSIFFIGIDVGTGSARAGVFTSSGILRGSASRAIQMWKSDETFVEQSSDDIWEACLHAVSEAMKISGVKPEQIGGLGFDATCSLVALDAQDRPVTISPSGEDARNVIVWMDHRAIDQAERINRTKHPVLRYVGGVISPEMQTPKLLWLKEKLPRSWRRIARAFDLPDFLTYRATGDDTRSLCSTVCKWTYLGRKGPDGAGWESSYFEQIGLGDLAKEGFARIGQKVRPMGQAIGNGLTEKAAKELGLLPGTPVGVSIIDAHAGGLGLLGASLGGQSVSDSTLSTRLALVGGTSSCHMAVSPEPRFIRGIWGPYYSAMIPDFWLTEGGQSATGSLIDHVIYSHSASISLAEEAKVAGKSIYELLNARLVATLKAEKTPFLGALTHALHVQPDFHGNRSPRANPTLAGTITGLTLSATATDLSRQYLATVQAVAYGTRHILEEMNRKGYRIDTIFACGGGTKNPVFLQEHADITGCTIVLPKEPEAVLLGAAVLGSVAAGRHGSVLDAMRAMNVAGKSIVPTGGRVTEYHDRKYQVFHQMHRDFLGYRRLMANF